ncbi:purine nucleosidase inosine-uridine preferring [Tetragenococcus halophilus subsp. flandriensis]|uniref:nucleoside hydrolase n=1 Tax=Tetragenococcus halophilus TaxID=51669 RepID=UPI0023EA4651|nr:nucleoside hydrolase [Tetragenococcus halophilus]GMA09106.1 purine nucleosidase inosine-uridine preferring [Tetragenococcus halophilus subsp. flandriensis]
MNTKKNIIIDCDPGIDDSLALLLALQSEELNVIGITIVSGNAPASIGAQNALKVLELLDRLDIPVYIGAEEPLEVPFVSAQDTHGEDGLGDSQIPLVTSIQPKAGAVSFIKDTLKQNPETTVLALGPLTNIALALKEDPDCFAKMSRFIVMGGSYRSHGNCSPVAEFNFWCDPDAANFVFSQNLPVPIEMVGLDVTRKIVLTPTVLEYMKHTQNEKIYRFIEQITQFYFEFHWEHEKVLGCVINDPLTIAYLLDPELAQGFNSHVEIATSGISRGQSIVDDHDFWQLADNCYILTNVDQTAFWHLFLTRVLKTEENELSQVLPQLLEVRS